MALIAVDTETGGLDSRKHAIIEVACVAVDEVTLSEIAHYHARVQFSVLSDGDLKALSVNKFDERTWAQTAKRADTVARELCRFVKQYASIERRSAKTGNPYRVAQMIGHNSAFDRDFITRWLERLSKKSRYPYYLPAAPHWICTMQRAVAYFVENARFGLTPPPSYSLIELAAYFGIDFPEADQHTALGDCRMCLELFRALTKPVRLAA